MGRGQLVILENFQFCRDKHRNLITCDNILFAPEQLFIQQCKSHSNQLLNWKVIYYNLLEYLQICEAKSIFWYHSSELLAWFYIFRKIIVCWLLIVEWNKLRRLQKLAVFITENLEICKGPIVSDQLLNCWPFFSYLLYIYRVATHGRR